VAGVIHIEIRPLGFCHVALAQPGNERAADRLWQLYRALRPEITALELAARREGVRVDGAPAPRNKAGRAAAKPTSSADHVDLAAAVGGHK
jgi:hypothetical protein